MTKRIKWMLWGIVLGGVILSLAKADSASTEDAHRNTAAKVSDSEKPMTADEFMSKLKGIRNEINKTVIEYDQEKEDFQKNLQSELNKLGDSGKDKSTKLKLMDDSQRKLDQMTTAFKARVDALKKKEDLLRMARYGVSQPPSSLPQKKNSLKEKQSIKDFEERKRKQDEEFKKEDDALKKAQEATQASETQKKIEAITQSPSSGLKKTSGY